MNRFWREPLVHFLVLGAALFLFDAFWPGAGSPEQRISISQARVNALAQSFARTWQRPPTAEELDGLVEEHIRDEVLTREALRLGLDRDDAVIRRRLRQKLEIVTEEAAAGAPVTDAELEAYRQAHAEQFRGEATFAFAQVFFDPARRGERLQADMARALERLNADDSRPASADLPVTGDALFVLQAQYPLTGERALAASFGEDFVAGLRRIPAGSEGRWVGPVESGYGAHLVRIERREPGAARPLAEIRNLVEREWRNDQRVTARERQYQQLRAGYRIDIAGKGPTP